MSTILVVEDAPELRELYYLVLTSHGYDVVTANDGVEALGTAKTSNFDFIMVDIYMPEMNGISLIRELRDLEKYQTTPIYVITSGENEKLVKRGMEAGATDWFVKPIDLKKLTSTIEGIIAI